MIHFAIRHCKGGTCRPGRVPHYNKGRPPRTARYSSSVFRLPPGPASAAPALRPSSRKSGCPRYARCSSAPDLSPGPKGSPQSAAPVRRPAPPPYGPHDAPRPAAAGPDAGSPPGRRTSRSEAVLPWMRQRPRPAGCPRRRTPHRCTHCARRWSAPSAADCPYWSRGRFAGSARRSGSPWRLSPLPLQAPLAASAAAG